jgi:hypothetical protein
MKDAQNIFFLFYAIFWGAIFNVQARWKAFQWPLLFSWYPPAVRRVLFSFLLLNLVPIGFLIFAIWQLGNADLPKWEVFWHGEGLWAYSRPILAAFAIFGIYRAWLGVIELFPGCFYASDVKSIPADYQHVEPTYQHANMRRMGDRPVVELADGAGTKNLIAAALYLLISIFSLLVK